MQDHLSLLENTHQWCHGLVMFVVLVISVPHVTLLQGVLEDVAAAPSLLADNSVTVAEEDSHHSGKGQ